MLSKSFSYGITGLEVYPVHIEIDVSGGLPAVNIVGLPDSAVRESKERVRAAIKNSGYKFPARRITINLSPADIKKEGPSFDLAMALGILASSEQIPSSGLDNFVLLGELSLAGQIKPINGMLPIALGLSARDHLGIILPRANASEAAIGTSLPIFPITTLKEAILTLSHPKETARFIPESKELKAPPAEPGIDFMDVKGQTLVKRGLEVAAAGGHNILMIGPPGSGKSMLAKRLPGILPDMTREESLETSRIHSTVGLIPPHHGLVTARPFRSPHHTASDIALVGGGSNPRPGEITLSHNGVLFLDELPEFSRKTLEALRQPLEDNCVTIARATRSLIFPARFMLVCSMNPCPCGWLSDPKKSCVCSSNQIQKYMTKISGPLLDRIDIHLEVPALNSTAILSQRPGESSSSIKARTIHARSTQEERFRGTSIYTNAKMDHKQLKTFCRLGQEGRDLLKRAIEELGFSARAHDKVLRVARTVSDLAGSEQILPEHIAEAIQYRCLDRNWR